MEMLFEAAAQYIGVSEQSLKQYVYQSRIPVCNPWIKGKWGAILSAIFAKEDLDTYLREKRVWNKLRGHEEEIRNLLKDPSITITAIGEKFGVSRERIRQKARQMGFTRKALKKRTQRFRAYKKYATRL